MKIHLIKQRFNDTVGYKYKPFAYCCDKIKDNPRIVFNKDADTEAVEEEEYMLPAFAIWHSETVGSWGDEWDNDYFYKINHCPFCGEPIEITVIDEEDMSLQFETLSKQRELLWAKYNRTDSKKESKELYAKVQELDSQINWFYELTEYPPHKQ